MGKKWEIGGAVACDDEIGDPVPQQDWNGTQISEKTDNFSQKFISN